MKLRLDDRNLARELRKQGCSFSEITARIPRLPKSTLNGWLKDIELTPEQKERILAKIKDAADRGRLKGAFTNREKRLRTTQQILLEAKTVATEKMSDPLFLIGVMLYWAEGNKTREEVGFTNSDPSMIRYMMRWFREICDVPEKKFRIALSIIALHDRTQAVVYWSRITGVPLSQFYKTTVKPTPLNGKRNPSYMGTCTIRICDKNLFRRILGWRLGIFDKLNLNAPIAQLDGAIPF